jgi:hypothetical protein
MSGAGRRPLARRFLLALAAIAIAGGVLGATLDADPAPVRRAPSGLASIPGLGPRSVLASLAASATSPACGPASAATIAGVDTTVAQGIYAAEIHSHEVSADVAHITGSQALLSALASSDEAGVYAAVHTIVYTPHWHIVRLRVVKAGRVLADVGGPDVIAPISGTLRWKGRTLATYVMSVQDDLGYMKLVSRFIGVPVDLYRNGAFLMGTLQPAPPASSAATSVKLRGATYLLQVLSARAFPSGSLRIALLVPTPSPTVAAASCASVALSAWGSIAMHVAARLEPLQAHYQALVDVLHGTTGGPAYVRSGSKRIAGGAVPAQLPTHGLLRYGGRTWAVFSWEPLPPARVYFLTPLS